MKPAFSRVARIGPMMKPLDSIPTTLVMPLSLYISYMMFDNSCRHHGSYVPAFQRELDKATESNQKRKEEILEAAEILIKYDLFHGFLFPFH